jgi:hypothetical protein
LKQKTPPAIMIISMVWIITVAGGFFMLTEYANRAGLVGEVTVHGPLSSSDHHQLSVFLHPECGCSKATLTELKKLLLLRGDELNTTIYFVQYKDWEEEQVKQSKLWQRARLLPHVRLMIDQEAAYSKSQGALTSGFSQLTTPEGHRVFNGGLTASRGHEGPNRGIYLLNQILDGKTLKNASSPVFGCAI